MKKTVLLLSLLWSMIAFSQEHAFKINPLALAFKGFEMSYETKITKNNSFELIGTFSKVDINNNKGKINVYGGEAKYKLFITPNVTTFEKLYVAPSLSYATGNAQEANAPVQYKLSYFSIGAFVGYQWLLSKNTKNGFMIDASLGAASYSLINNTNIYDEDIEGLKPRGTLSIGYTF